MREGVKVDMEKQHEHFLFRMLKSEHQGSKLAHYRDLSNKREKVWLIY